MKNYQEWLDSLVNADERGGKYLCPLDKRPVSMFGRKRLLGCNDGYCASWKLFKEHEKALIEGERAPEQARVGGRE